MELLNQPLHNLSKVLFILDTQHTNQINNFLDEGWILKVDTFDQSDENIFVVIYQVCVEILK